MDSPESLENLIPDDISKKLNDAGVSFSELRQACTTPEKLTEANIYSLAQRGNTS